MKRLAVLGSTGSIGTSTLDVVARHSDKYKVVALVAGTNVELLAKQIKQFNPSLVAVRDSETLQKLRTYCSDSSIQLNGIELDAGENAIANIAAATEVDMIVAAIVGAAGLRSTVAAAKAGKEIALANKESLVVAGELVTRLVKENNAVLLPVDSEHAAVFQGLSGQNRKDVVSITLTASGGPFRDWPLEKFHSIKKSEALNHPNWSMGAKITIDSATMMNKGLELIEARWLFDAKPSELNVVVHRESIVHALVEYRDGSVMAQLAMPDMRSPIAYALAYPARIESGIERLNLAKIGQLTFSEPDEVRFPALRLAKNVLTEGGMAPAILNAANEMAVNAFLEDKIGFMAIPSVVEKVLIKMSGAKASTLDEILELDKLARISAEEVIK